MASAGGIKAGRAWVEIGAVDRTSRVLRMVSRKFQQFGAKLQSIGRTAIASAFVGLTPAAFGLATFAKFDDSLRKVSARSSGTREEMGALRKQAKDLGRTTSFTASQVGELQAKLAQKGFNRSDIKNLTPDVLNLARAGGSGDLEADAILSADLVASTLRQFKMGSEEAARVADVMSAAVNNSSVDLQGLINSMSKAGPVAKDFNLSLEDTVGVVGMLTNLGVEASEAGTALRNMFLETSDPGKMKAFQDMLKEATGQTIAFGDSQGNLRHLPTLMAEIGEALGGLGTLERSAILQQLFGKRVISKASGFDPAQFKKLQQALMEAEGSAKRTADEMDSGIGGAMRAAMSAAEATAIAIGEGLWMAIQDVFGITVKAIRAFAEWVSKNQILIASVFGIIAGVGAFGASLLVAGLALQAVGVALAALVSPLGLVAVGFTGIVASLLKFTSLGESVRGVLSSIGSEAGKTFTAIKQALGGGNFTDAAKLAWLQIQVIWKQGITKLLNFFDTLTAGIAVSFMIAIQKLQEILNGLLNRLQDAAALIPGKLGMQMKLGAYNANQKLMDSYLNIDKQKQAVKDALKSRLQGRNKEVDELQQELEGARAMEYFKAWQRKLTEMVGNVGNATKKTEETAKGTAKGTAAARSVMGGNTIPQTIQALEKGSVAAMEQFVKNQANREKSLEQEQLDKLSSIDKSLKDAPVVRQGEEA